MNTALRTKRSGGVPARPQSYYLDVGREYVALYGAAELTQAAFNPGTAKRSGRPDLVERYYSPRPSNGEPWPSLNAIKTAFGTRKHPGKWNDFRKALDLPPNTAGPAPGRVRRPRGEADPILTVRERRVVVPSEQTAYVRKQLAAAERRALRAEERLEAAKREVSEVPAEHDRLVKALRDRLADEKSRRKDVQRELNNAVRREERARARTEIVATREDPTTLREVDRLTDRLAVAEARVRELEAAPRGTTVVVREAKPQVRTQIKTRTRTVTVADEQALRRAERAEKRLTELREEHAALRSARDDLASRLAEIRREAVATALVDRRVRTAEGRVREVEAELAELTEVLLGARRMPTQVELQALRTNGPAGQAIFKAAVMKVARAEGGGARKAALWDVIGAARNWIDRL